MMSTKGVRGILYQYFRKKEQRLYSVSDRIGCMSPANVDYVVRNNPEVNPTIVEVCPNSIEIIDKSVDEEKRKIIRDKYSIPLNKVVFVYGGNLGKPQDVPFIIKCLKAVNDIEDAFFLIVGDGTEFHLIDDYLKLERPTNVRLMKRLPKEDYDSMVGACDIGLLFLDHRFTIPNFPSRIVSYMQARLPVLACTDPNTDIGKVITEGKFGWWCESNSVDAFRECIFNCLQEDLSTMKNNAWDELCRLYDVEDAYSIIMAGLKDQ